MIELSKCEPEPASLVMSDVYVCVQYGAKTLTNLACSNFRFPGCAYPERDDKGLLRG